jgi:hypothetical protein
MKTVKMTELPKLSSLPSADEMLVPIYRHGECLYQCSVADLTQLIINETLKSESVTIHPSEDGIIFIENYEVTKKIFIVS